MSPEITQDIIALLTLFALEVVLGNTNKVLVDTKGNKKRPVAWGLVWRLLPASFCCLGSIWSNKPPSRYSQFLIKSLRAKRWSCSSVVPF